MTKSKYNPPLTFDLTRAQVKKIETFRRKLGMRSASAVVRHALETLKLDQVRGREPRFAQISVRITPKHRAQLRRQAAGKHLSIGELIRSALEQLG